MTYFGVDQRSSSSYRPDIDGLRAIAILSILLFHLDFATFSGGFVGVDIFFVISGYLIGGGIKKSVADNKYILPEFYRRRICRIVPAMFFMLFVTSLLSCLVLFPENLVKYGMSLLFAATASANFYYLYTSNYFASDTASHALVHMWSLSVEEQFYILFPIIIIASRKLSEQKSNFILILLLIISLSMSIAYTRVYPDSSFYMLHTRMWEFLAGYMVFNARKIETGSVFVSEFIAALGMALIIYAVIIFDKNTIFPGYAAIIPCLGTALVIFSGERRKTFVSNLISSKIFVFFGLISYSLYLWHWPLIVLVKQYYAYDLLPFTVSSALFIIAVMISVLSWRFIERPWRGTSIKAATAFSMGAASVGILLIFAAVLIAFRGFPDRFPPDIVRIAQFDEKAAMTDFREGSCFLTARYALDDFDKKSCMRGRDGAENIIIVGDSHAAQFWTGLKSQYPAMNILQATSSGCRPLLFHKVEDNPRCTRLMDYVFKDFAPKHKDYWLLLAGNWFEGDAEFLKATLIALHRQGFKVALVGPIVKYTLPLPQLIATSRLRGESDLLDRRKDPESEILDGIYRRIAHDTNTVYFSPYKALCDHAECISTLDNGVPVQFDYGHLTSDGSRYVATRFRLDQALR